MMSPHEVIAVATAVHADRYPDARLAFACGSIVRGEGTPHSDLDLVVLFDQLDNAYRESFTVDALPVEAFVHDPGTARYFMVELDRTTGVPSLCNMITGGVAVPGICELGRSVRENARAVLAAGPPMFTGIEDQRRRYHITDLLEDLRSPRNAHECLAAGVTLYRTLGDYHLRADGRWSGVGKGLIRALDEADPLLAARYTRVFEELAKGHPSGAIALTEEILTVHGGPCFEGYRDDAPADWRRPEGQSTSEPPDPDR